MDSNKKIYGYTQEQLTNIFNEYKNENDSIDTTEAPQSGI